jgi:heterodisulfide reductase subunit C
VAENKTLEWRDEAFMREVEERSGAQVSACYQCHQCTTGCPVAPEADLTSSQIMRLIHLGAEEEVLGSQAIWLCASCETCTARCPMGINVAGVMDTLRIMAVERCAKPPSDRSRHFNEAFLASVRRHGRVFELGMMTGYKLRTRDFLADMDKAPKMLAKRKLSLLPPSRGGRQEARRIFKRAEEEERKR